MPGFDSLDELAASFGGSPKRIAEHIRKELENRGYIFAQSIENPEGEHVIVPMSALEQAELTDNLSHGSAQDRRNFVQNGCQHPVCLKRRMELASAAANLSVRRSAEERAAESAANSAPRPFPPVSERWKQGVYYGGLSDPFSPENMANGPSGPVISNSVRKEAEEKREEERRQAGIKQEAEYNDKFGQLHRQLVVAQAVLNRWILAPSVSDKRIAEEDLRELWEDLNDTLPRITLPS